MEVMLKTRWNQMSLKYFQKQSKKYGTLTNFINNNNNYENINI